MAASPPALAPPPGNPRFPLLDGMRAVAALLIVVTHASGASNFNTANPLGVYTARMNLGVTMFFLLSGFLLYRPFVAARREGRPPIRIRDFARRRALRIVPAYWVALTLLSIYPGLYLFSDYWPRLYTFTQIYSARSTLAGIGPAWSLCIEASFYVALPFIALGIARLRPSVRGEVGALIALAIGSLALRTYLHDTHGPPILQNTLLCYLDWFCWGMIMAVISVATHGREASSRSLTLIVRRPWVPWATAAVVFWVLSTRLELPRGFFAIYTDYNYFGEHVLYALVSLLLLLPAMFGGWAGGWPRRLVGLRVMAWLGLVSYAIFLYHLPIMGEINAHGAQGWLPGSGFLSLLLCTLAITIPIAAASYYVVERPALRLKERRRPAGPPQPEQIAEPEPPDDDVAVDVVDRAAW